MNLLFIDNFRGSGFTGKIVLIIWQIFHRCENIEEIENIYIDLKKLPLSKICFENHNGKKIDKIIETPHKYSVKGPVTYYKIHESSYFQKLSKIAKKIKFNKSLFEKKNFDLGIHIRLTDMNRFHGHQHGFVYFNDYDTFIKKIINQNIKSIFVASDNKKSLLKLKKYGITYNKNNYIESSENFTGIQGLNNKNKKEFYIDIMKDVFSLSKSNKLIFRTSCVSILALLLSDIKQENIFQINNKN